MIRIIRKVIYLFLTLIMAFTFANCSSEAQKEEKGNDFTYNELIGELKNNGYKVNEIKQTEDDIKHSFLSVPPHFLDVNGESMFVYEFPDSKTSDSQAETISEDGNKVGNAFIEWIDKPYFYKKGKLIVGYAGSSNQILKCLKKILGKPITK